MLMADIRKRSSFGRRYTPLKSLDQANIYCSYFLTTNKLSQSFKRLRKLKKKFCIFCTHIVGGYNAIPTYYL